MQELITLTVAISVRYRRKKQTLSHEMPSLKQRWEEGEEIELFLEGLD